MIAAGTSAGVSSVFGAPIGGALFSYEISKPNTFWTFIMVWRVFACSSVATFLLGCFSQLYEGYRFSLDEIGSLKFGLLKDKASTLRDLPAPIIIGAVCGLLGSFFIQVNTTLGILRKKYLKKNWQKILEAVIFALASATIYFVVVVGRDEICRYNAGSSLKTTDLERFRCPENQFNPLATLLFNTEGGTIRSFLAYPSELKNVSIENAVPATDILIYFCVWYSLTIITYGVWVPAGLFIPGILIGCSVAIIYLDVLVFGLGVDINLISGQSYIIIGATAMLASYCRLTYSLAVIMLETT